MKNTAITIAMAGVLVTASAANAGIPTPVSDHVWNDGTNSVIWGPGIWTRDGMEIGRTFPMGIVQPGGVESHDWDMIVLPVRPNDFHFDVEILLPTNPITIQVWAEWDVDNPIDVWFEFHTFFEGSSSNYDVSLDLTNNTASVMDVNTSNILYSGPADPFLGSAPLPGGFEPLPATLLFHIPAPATFGMTCAALGLLAARRRR
ncbi:MAG: hypothetical protein VYC34_02885 [Planctomycetota bacterium]|nr:hypothetical protein [Planctomycetota bacterium]